MKMKHALTGLLVLQSILAFSQPVPVEAMAGGNNYWYQHSVYRQFPAGSRFGFFHVSSLQVFYNGDRANQVMSQSYLTYRLTAGAKLALGSFYATGPGFSPSLAVQFTKKTDDWLLLIVPRVDLTRNATCEAMVMAEYTPMLSKKVGIYSRVQLMSNYGTCHNRSYQHLRIGLSVNRIRFGGALNLDEYAREKQIRANVGVFIKTDV
jgi:hypothetical protein